MEGSKPPLTPWADAPTMDSASCWFTPKLKRLMLLLLEGQQVEGREGGSAAASPLAWRGLAMVFVERKVRASTDELTPCSWAFNKGGVHAA